MSKILSRMVCPLFGGRVAQLVNDVGIFAIRQIDRVWRGVHVSVVSPHDVGLSELDTGRKNNVDMAIDVENHDVAALELSRSDALAVFGVCAAGVEGNNFHGLPFVYTVVCPSREGDSSVMDLLTLVNVFL